MDEATIRAVFAHIEAVRARWDADEGTIEYVPEQSCARLNEDGRTVDFLFHEYGMTIRAAIPLLAFTDYAAGVAQRDGEHAARQAAHETEREQRDRATYERLRAKFEGA